ncbi:MAG: chromosomal replication initiator protein DnaA [Candidatus Eisenbacteria bacterium]
MSGGSAVQDFGQNWEEVLVSLRSSLDNEQRFATWFRPLILKSLEGEHLTLEVPNPFFIDWFEEHNLPILQHALREAWGWEPRVSFVVRENFKEIFRQEAEKQRCFSPVSQPQPQPSQKATLGEGNLNPRFSFENFVVGRSNELAHAACQAVAKDPGHVYNPLFVYGGAGLGKTHLMHAIGLVVQAGDHRRKVQYVPAETFMNDMIEAIRAGTTQQFRDHYRRLDCLLIDDIQFLAGRGRTEEEFFHTFNSLYDANKQVIISCDRRPNDLTSLEERLTSRFQCGLVADIHPPDLETRMAILRQKSSRDGLDISDRILFLLAENIRANIRELEGALIRLSALSSLTSSPVTEELARDALRDYLKGIGSGPPDIGAIQRIVAKYFEVTVESMRGKRRTSQVALARQTAMYLAKQRTGMTLVEIGKRFGNRDHSTVIYALTRVGDEMSKSQEFRDKIARIEEELNGPLSSLSAGRAPATASSASTLSSSSEKSGEA